MKKKLWFAPSSSAWSQSANASCFAKKCRAMARFSAASVSVAIRLDCGSGDWALRTSARQLIQSAQRR